jgi:hypothetical protein
MDLAASIACARTKIGMITPLKKVPKKKHHPNIVVSTGARNVPQNCVIGGRHANNQYKEG